MEDRQHLKNRAIHSVDRTIQASHAYQAVLSSALNSLQEREQLLDAYKQSLQSVALVAQAESYPLHGFQDDQTSLALSSPSSSRRSSLQTTVSTSLESPDWTSIPVTEPHVQHVHYSFFTDELGTIPLPATSMSEIRPHLFAQPCEWTQQERITLRRAIRNFICFQLLKRGRLSLQAKVTPQLDAFWPEIPESDLDWEHISLTYFRNTKTPMDCRVQWLSWDHPAYAKVKISEQEIALIEQRHQEGFQNWIELAKSLPLVRSPVMAFWAYQKELRSIGAYKERSGRKWTPVENALLLQATELYGLNSWTQVAQVLGTRESKQCLHHWKTIDPAVRTGAFTTDEDDALMAAHARFGDKWSHVARWVLGRTDAQCRERHLNLRTTSVRAVPWTEDENKCILAFVTLHGMRWSQLAEWLPARSDRDVAFQYQKLRREIEAGKRALPTGAQLPLDQRSRNQLVKKIYPVDPKVSFEQVSSGLIPPNVSSLCALEKLLRVIEKTDSESELVPATAPVDDPSSATNEGGAAQNSCLPRHPNMEPSLNEVLPPLSTPTAPPPNPLAQPLESPILDTMIKHFLLSMFMGTVQVRPLGWEGVEHALELREQLIALVQELNTPHPSTSDE